MLELLVEDGQCNGKDATSAMQKLVNVDGVKFVIGGFC
jgi:ABC-type branched-subunit amino acid transport system substrate-binding protein|tara:strand:+ start:1489 stop:1602 length:114 start_codon:yes stop_codon:yes gene_type:complete